MSAIHSDALVFFGATGDLAYKKIFPSLQSMVKRGHLDVDAYERVLGDAMAGDAAIFARQDYVEQAWRIVDPILKRTTPAYEYQPRTWGPNEAAQLAPPGGWVNPTIASSAAAAKAGSFN